MAKFSFARCVLLFKQCTENKKFHLQCVQMEFLQLRYSGFFLFLPEINLNRNTCEIKVIA